MTRSLTSQPVLRLVGDNFSHHKKSTPVIDNKNYKAVSQEMWAALGNHDLDPNDPRWILASYTVQELQGTALTPQRRQKILQLAHKLGVRQFDANLVVAIVQDEARQGNLNLDYTQFIHYNKISQPVNQRDISNAIATVNSKKPAIQHLSKQLVDRLKIIPNPNIKNKQNLKSDNLHIASYIIVSIILATIMFFCLLNWLGI